MHSLLKKLLLTTFSLGLLWSNAMALDVNNSIDFEQANYHSTPEKKQAAFELNENPLFEESQEEEDSFDQDLDFFGFLPINSTYFDFSLPFGLLWHSLKIVNLNNLSKQNLTLFILFQNFRI